MKTKTKGIFIIAVSIAVLFLGMWIGTDLETALGVALATTAITGIGIGLIKYFFGDDFNLLS